jgi:hypothetical protein
MMRLVWLPALVLLSFHAEAQQAQLQSGARVRVWETQSAVELIAPVRSADSRAITLDAPDGPLTIEWTKVSEVDVSGGPGSGPRWRNGLIGGLAGVIGGGLLGAIIGDAAHRNTPKFAAAGIGIGAALGAVIGVSRPGERWTRVSIDDRH